jgi:hypothetical protein
VLPEAGIDLPAELRGWHSMAADWAFARQLAAFAAAAWSFRELVGEMTIVRRLV